MTGERIHLSEYAYNLGKLTRPTNCLVAALSVFVGGLISVGLDATFSTFLIPIFFACFAALFATAGGNVLNDFLDHEVDKISHPERPLPAGKVGPRPALLFAAFCFIITAPVAYMASQLCLIIGIINIVSLVVYEQWLKDRGLSGNIMIAYLCASLFLFGGAATTDSFITLITSDYILKVGIFFVLTFLVTVSREIVKDIEDIHGDEGVRYTLPMRIGIHRTSLIAGIVLLSAIPLSWIPYLMGIFPLTYLLLILAAAAVFFYCIALIIKINTKHEYAKKVTSTMKIGMFISLMAFMIGGII